MNLHSLIPRWLRRVPSASPETAVPEARPWRDSTDEEKAKIAEYAEAMRKIAGVYTPIPDPAPVYPAPLFPSGLKLTRAERNDAIRCMRAEGKTMAQIAERFGLTPAGVGQILGPTPRVAKPGPRPKPKAPRLAAPAIPVGPARTAYVRRRLAAGDKLQPIADSLGISRERVRQIARDNGFRELTDPRRRRQTKPCPQCGGPMIVTASTTRLKHCSRGCAQAARRKEWAADLERVCALRREGVGWVAVGKKFGMTQSQMLSAAFRWAAELGVEIPLGPNYGSRPGPQRLR